MELWKLCSRSPSSFVEKAHNSHQTASLCSRRCLQGDLSRHKEKSFAPNSHAFNLMEFERYRKFKWNFLIKLHRPEDSLFLIILFYRQLKILLMEKRETVAVWRLSREPTLCCMFGFLSQGQSAERWPAGGRLRGVCAGDFIWELTPFCGCRSPSPAAKHRRAGRKNGKTGRKWTTPRGPPRTNASWFLFAGALHATKHQH